MWSCTTFYKYLVRQHRGKQEELVWFDLAWPVKVIPLHPWELDSNIGQETSVHLLQAWTFLDFRYSKPAYLLYWQNILICDILFPVLKSKSWIHSWAIDSICLNFKVSLAYLFVLSILHEINLSQRLLCSLLLQATFPRGHIKVSSKFFRCYKQEKPTRLETVWIQTTGGDSDTEEFTCIC